MIEKQKKNQNNRHWYEDQYNSYLNDLTPLFQTADTILHNQVMQRKAFVATNCIFVLVL